MFLWDMRLEQGPSLGSEEFTVSAPLDLVAAEDALSSSLLLPESCTGSIAHFPHGPLCQAGAHSEPAPAPGTEHQDE